MPPVGFEPTISAGERPQTYALDRAATGNLFILQLPYLNHTGRSNFGLRTISVINEETLLTH